MASDSGYKPSFGIAADNDPGAISIIGLPDSDADAGFSGSEIDLASRDTGTVPSGSSATAGGWGAKVKVVDTPVSDSGDLISELTMPKLPEAGVGLARGARDMIDGALEKGKSVLPETMGGAIDVARGDIDDLRVRTTANGATGSELDARVAKMVAEGDEYFDRRLFIAPARSNATPTARPSTLLPATRRR
jgi:hypothetical protein